MKVRSLNRDPQEKDTTSKTIGNLCQNVNDFIAVLYDNSKLFNF